jgi:tetratricopeptide (TPR) repeat protein
MPRFRWIALQGSSRGFLPPLLLLFLITTSGIPAHAADDPAVCGVPFARIVSIQGTIELLRARQNNWSKVTRLDTPLCEGDRLRTGALSRAALFIQPETLVRVDQNTSISVSQTAEETLVEFTQEDIVATSATAHTCGAGYFITRFPRKFRVNTPHLNAAVEGTEFLVAMRCESTELSVFEGKVLAAGAGANIFPAQSISSGQTLTIGGSEPPAIKLIVKPADAVQWVLYYPPLSDATAEADLPSAEQCRGLPKPLDQTCLTQRAEVLLRLGRVDEAQREVDEAVALDSGRGNGNALRAIISIARNNKAGAIEAATAATTASPNSFRAWLALSYAQQASFKLEDSLVSARKAQALEPNSSVTNARVAELLMSLGRIKEAEIAARAAVDTNPSESRARTVLGFVHLAQIKTKAARADFEAAIERDSSDPLPRVGLGLAIIRDGKLVDGREQLEIAVALDPTNSLVRSYVGKAYYEQNSRERDKLAELQFGIAKALDPKDPTPWYYDAILKQTQNRPSDALANLQKSIELNDNRAVYRSRLLLDEDSAARSVSLARIYDQAGFERLGVTEASDALAIDPSSSEAHRFLSDIYLRTPRHEIARVSELLQAQLLQSQSMTPVQPRLAVTEFNLATAAGPSRAGIHELAPLFDRDGLYMSASTVGGSQNTWGDELIISALKNRASLSVGQLHYQTDGFRENNDIRNDTFNVFTQFAVSPDLSVQAEVISFRNEFGDIALNFDPSTFSSTDRKRVNNDSARFGGRLKPCPECDLLVSVAYVDRSGTLKIEPPGVIVDDRVHIIGQQAEVEYIFLNPRFNVAIGGGTYHLDQSESTILDFTPSFGEPCPAFIAPCDFSASSGESQNNGYAYLNVNPVPLLLMTLGTSYDDYRAADLKVRRWGSKFGLQWKPVDTLNLRLASFQTVKRALPLEQTIEPTQVAGFNQFFDDVNGTIAKRIGVGLDFRTGSMVAIGAEASRREIDFPITFLGGGSAFEDEKEELLLGYLLWSASPNWGFRLEYRQDMFSRTAIVDDDRPVDLKTRAVPFTINRFGPAGFNASVTVSYVDQSVERLPTSTLASGSDSFTVVDASVGYRLTRRRGLISLEAHNLFNAHFRYQDDNFRTSSQTAISPYCPCQQILLKFVVAL